MSPTDGPQIWFCGPWGGPLWSLRWSARVCCCHQQVSLISLIRSVLRTTQPFEPFERYDANEIGLVPLTADRALLDGDQPLLPRLPRCPLRRFSAHAGARGNGGEWQFAAARADILVADDAHDCHLPDRQSGGEVTRQDS